MSNFTEVEFEDIAKFNAALELIKPSRVSILQDGILEALRKDYDERVVAAQNHPVYAPLLPLATHVRMLWANVYCKSVIEQGFGPQTAVKTANLAVEEFIKRFPNDQDN